MSTFTLQKIQSGDSLTPTEYNLTVNQIQAAIRALQDASASNGTVTSISDVDTDVAEIFSTAIATATTTPVTTFSRVSKAANLIYASPSSGASAKPTFRALVAADLPTVPFSKGGNGLTSLGTAYQIQRVNSGASAIEYFSLTAGSSKLSITPSAGVIALDVVPANIDKNGLGGSALSIANGGSGQTSQQAAIKALTAGGSGTIGHVLTLDSSNNPIWSAQSVGIVTLNGQTGTTVTLTTTNIAEGSNLYYTDVRVAANSAVVLNTAKVTNATHTGDVTGATALTIANNAVTYAKMQNISATKRLLGRVTAAAGVTEEVQVAGNLALNSTSIISRTSKLKTVTVNTSVDIVEGTYLINGSTLTITLPDTTTVADGDEFIFKNMAGATTNTLSVFNIGTETIDGATTQSMSLAHDSLTVKYGGSSKWYIISKVVGA